MEVLPHPHTHPHTHLMLDHDRLPDPWPPPNLHTTHTPTPTWYLTCSAALLNSGVQAGCPPTSGASASSGASGSGPSSASSSLGVQVSSSPSGGSRLYSSQRPWRFRWGVLEGGEEQGWRERM